MDRLDERAAPENRSNRGLIRGIRSRDPIARLISLNNIRIDTNFYSSIKRKKESADTDSYSSLISRRLFNLEPRSRSISLRQGRERERERRAADKNINRQRRREAERRRKRGRLAPDCIDVW